MGVQLSMAGDDWLSDRDRKQQARAEAARKKTAIVCARKLRDAVDALNDFMHASNEVGDGGAVRRADDGRVLMVGSLMEYASFLESVYDK